MIPQFETVEQERAFWKERRHLYHFQKFTIRDIEFYAAIPKDRYDPFKILELLDKHFGKEKASG